MSFSHAKQVIIGVLGGLVVLIGIVLIPYPGPGWVIVFAGLAILAREFAWARRLLDSVRAKYDVGMAWLKRQSKWVQALFGLMTFIVVVLTLWLLNAYGLILIWLKIDIPWLFAPWFG